ncbi:hypothetical protein DNTS_000416, partial [Danionella cerebrum]
RHYTPSAQSEKRSVNRKADRSESSASFLQSGLGEFLISISPGTQLSQQSSLGAWERKPCVYIRYPSPSPRLIRLVTPYTEGHKLQTVGVCYQKSPHKKEFIVQNEVNEVLISSHL